MQSERDSRLDFDLIINQSIPLVRLMRRNRIVSRPWARERLAAAIGGDSRQIDAKRTRVLANWHAHYPKSLIIKFLFIFVVLVRLYGTVCYVAAVPKLMNQTWLSYKQNRNSIFSLIPVPGDVLSLTRLLSVPFPDSVAANLDFCSRSTINNGSVGLLLSPGSSQKKCT